MAHEGFHEAVESLRPETLDRHRAIESIMEELEAVDWYAQRVEATGDPELAGILAHNRDEEKEHAAMTLEWLRRHDAKLADAGGAAATGGSDGSLGIGSLRAPAFSLTPVPEEN
jgi:hypothetical protein